ncbi:hypothetical protein SBA2_300004 [Acidobacteriia bacterium SbA2]|nr:hypothetical protein SBA2_300004 [Acidobacteriia bacterium SbA2]
MQIRATPCANLSGEESQWLSSGHNLIHGSSADPNFVVPVKMELSDLSRCRSISFCNGGTQFDEFGYVLPYFANAHLPSTSSNNRGVK